METQPSPADVPQRRPEQERPPDGKEIAELAHQLFAVSQRIDEIQVAQARSDAEIDHLQVEVYKPRQWYRDPSVMIAVFALLLSLLTTAYGFVRERSQIVQVERAELRSVIRRLNEIERERALNQEQYSGSLESSLNGSLVAEGNALIDQGFEIARRIPDFVTSSEYFTLANHLFTKGDNEGAGEFYSLAIQKAGSPFEKVAALRSYAGLLMGTGKAAEGRGYFEEAMLVFDDESLQVTGASRPYINAYTQFYWANSELDLGECAAANEHYEQAFEFANQLADSPFKEGILEEFEQRRVYFQLCQAASGG